ncbi:hypothetical protein O181_062318 [Austropuccinia psidii MF-1]|uniref:Apple domain-containing protein n=1 Tax=Austropuccinia psidii MF-1 TaxID=1389203 RepID=A0A9Q3EJI2_9BASI|nr:hypothetical protein [Austropuccinia psidii MF-1]
MFSRKAFIFLGIVIHKTLGHKHAAAPKASFENRLSPRQLNVGCGLSFNAAGMVSLVQASGSANLCLQCRISVFGVFLKFSTYDSVASGISHYGVSQKDAAILQASIQGDLTSKATGCHSTGDCQMACSLDNRCESYNYQNGQCNLVAQNYLNNPKAGSVLAKAFEKIFDEGGSQYCGICPGDRSCTSPSGRARRSLPSAAAKSTSSSFNCPKPLVSCPISRPNSLTSSGAYECLDVREEITSCGGCETLGEGLDCTSLKGVKSAGCAEGKCVIFSCKDRYKYDRSENVCRKLTHKGKVTTKQY